MARKCSDGQSVRVVVPASTTVVAGSFTLLDNFFGMAIQGAANGVGVTSEIILDIEQCEYETSQITVADAFAKGAPVYWIVATGLLSVVASTNRLVGRVTMAKDGNNVIRFKLGPQGI